MKEAEMSSSQVSNAGESMLGSSSAGRGGGAPDWDRIHAQVQGAFDGLRDRVAEAVPGSLSRPGRASAPAFELFSYRVFYRADFDEDDPVLAGVMVQDQGSSYRVSGDVSGEESGRIYCEEACDVPKDAADLVERVRGLSERLAAREAVVVEALSPHPREDVGPGPLRSSDG
jgi:hypothetical protein